MAGGFGGMADSYLERNMIYTRKELYSKTMIKKEKIRYKPRTYEEWKGMGYHVVRGQKAWRFRDDGKAVFKMSQVAKTRHGNYADGGWENIHEQSDLWDHPDFYDGWDNIGDKD